MEDNRQDVQVFEQKHNCVQEEAPACTAACPLRVDMRQIMAHIQKGKWEAALESYRSAVLFPRLVAALCTQPCRAACLRGELDAPLEIRLVERALVAEEGRPARPRFVRPKNQSVAVVGAGLCGLGCAVTLAQKGYAVTLYEKEARPGGEALENPALEAEILAGLENAGVMLHLSCAVENPALLQANAVLAAGCFLPAAQAGLWQSGPGEKLFFAGGEAAPERKLALGKRAATAIEQYLSGLLQPELDEPPGGTRLFTPLPEGLPPCPAVPPGPEGGYSRGQAEEEAGRCLLCECKACLPHCLFLQEGRQYPKQYIVEAQQSLRTLKLLQSKLKARRTNACNLCGLCRELCPGGVDMSEVYLYSRRIMHRQGELPEAFHAFWLADMAFSHSEEAFLCKAQPGYQTVAYLFFPGCQMGGAQPRHVRDSYRYLTQKLAGGVGLYLGCCGAPAEWAGREEKTEALWADFRARHSALGSPTLILACPSCEKLFAKYLPDIPRLSLWRVLGEHGLPGTASAGAGRRLALFDPCASRYSPETQQQVRALLGQMGYRAEELPHHGRYAQCCGYGGLIYASNPEMAKTVAADRVAASPLPYVSYCTNCCEIFRREGKPTWHLLDLLFGQDGQKLAETPAASYSARRENRRALKKELLAEVWKEDGKMKQAPEWLSLRLQIPQALRAKMEAELMLEENLQEAIYVAEKTQNKLAQGGQFICHRQVGVVTYWVYYRALGGDEYAVDKAYCHRMQIEEAL